MGAAQAEGLQRDWFIFEGARAEIAFMVHLGKHTHIRSTRLRFLVATMWLLVFCRFTYAFAAGNHPLSMGAPHALERYAIIAVVYLLTSATQAYFGLQMLGIRTDKGLLRLEALKAWAQTSNHTLCMVCCLLLHGGEIPITTPSSALLFATYLHTFLTG
ncbi:hypothetical protein WJX81_000498 [Elliptochloris bilobata]|uniref:Uncharacterized protein n=1 Tax=Elliptochloris bilobata TaxID=381761 RepID=A0AAW1QZE5_9CHLO